MATADVSDVHQRLSLESHSDVLHAFIADWIDDDMLAGNGGDTSAFTHSITPSSSPRDAERGPMAQSLLAPHTPVIATRVTRSAAHTASSPMSDMDAATSIGSSPSSPESDFGAAAPHSSPSAAASPAPASYHIAAAAKRGKAVTAAAAAAAPAARRKRTLPKVEIARLREHAHTLETQLLELREYWKSAPTRLRESNTTGAGAGAGSKSQNTVTEPGWQHAATSQRKLLSAAEERNLTLRAKYELNRKVARALRKVLMKRRTSPATFDSALYLLPRRCPQQVFADSSDTFKTLLRDIEPMYADTARIEQLMAARLPARLDPQSLAFRDWQLQNEHARSRSDVVLEAVDCFALPFDHTQVVTAMQQLHDAPSRGNTNAHFCEFFERCGDSTMRQVVFAYKHPKQQGYVRNKDVAYFFRSATHSVVVSVTYIEPVTEQGVPIAGIAVRERKWVIVRNEVASHDSSSRSSDDGDVDGGDDGDQEARTDRTTSLVCSYHKISCDHIAKGFESFWTPSVLFDTLVPSWSMTLVKGQRSLEACLLEQSVAESKQALVTEVAK